jgi:four helix bundle protein
MISRLSIVEEEADETLYWLDLLVDSKKIESNHVKALHNEVHEIVAMTVASLKTLRGRTAANPKSKIQNLK